MTASLTRLHGEEVLPESPLFLGELLAHFPVPCCSRKGLLPPALFRSFCQLCLEAVHQGLFLLAMGHRDESHLSLKGATRSGVSPELGHGREANAEGLTHTAVQLQMEPGGRILLHTPRRAPTPMMLTRTVTGCLPGPRAQAQPKYVVQHWGMIVLGLSVSRCCVSCLSDNWSMWQSVPSIVL